MNIHDGRTMNPIAVSSEVNEDKMREEFEVDAKSYGFELVRYSTLCTTDEPWSDYVSLETGHRWGGWLAGCESKQKEIDADATRYRWLRDNKHLDDWWSVSGSTDRCENIDADIDEAMKEKQND